MRGDTTRSQIAREAARLMLEGGLRDFQLAKRKAASRLGVFDRGEMPTNLEIEEAMSDYQRLFRADSQPQKLAALRRSAVNAMDFLSDFEPRLVGSVLGGTADEHSVVELHLYSDAPEEIGLFLDAKGIPHELGEKRLRIGPDETRFYPAFGFFAGDSPIELVVLPWRMHRRPPISPVTGKAMQRASIDKVRKLLDDEEVCV